MVLLYYNIPKYDTRTSYQEHASKTTSKNPFARKAEYRPVRKNAITSEPSHFHIQIPRAAVVKGFFLYRIPKSVVEIISAGCFLNQTYQVTSTTKKPRFWSFVAYFCQKAH